MQFKTISEVMKRDHDKIVKLLNDLDNCIDLDKLILKKAFDTFKWELEKHLFIEEKVIFTSYEPKDFEVGYKMVHRLMHEHDIIYKQLKGIEKIIKSKKQCNLQEFKEIIIKHKDFENEQVYPKFDQELDEATKKMIIKRVSDVKLNDTGLNNIKVKCFDCGKKIGITSSYYNQKFGKRWFFCSECYDKLERKESPIIKKIGSGG
jgi:hemerythrin-like domain-containing protein